MTDLSSADQTADDVRDQLLHAIDFNYAAGLGYGTPEGLLAAYDASRTPPPAERAALRKLLITALDNAHHTHPCPALGDQTWSGCVHYDDAGRMLGVGVCHSERRADAVLAVLPEPADRATEVEQLRIKNERMRHELEVMYSGAFDSTEPADRAELDSLGREADRLRKAWGEMRDRAERIEAEVKRMRAEVEQWRATFGRDALSGALRRLERAEADRATFLREEADRIDATRAQFPIAVQNGITWATAELRRHAAETATTETEAPDIAWHILTRQRGTWRPWLAPRDDHAEAREDYDRCVADNGHRWAFRLVRETSTFTVEDEHQPADGARQDVTATDEPAPGSTEPRPCRTFVSGGTVWCCEEGETDCPCVCHQPAAGARQDKAQPSTPPCTHCTHPKGDHDGRADHRAKYPSIVAGEPWCHACNAPCDYTTAGARQDGAQP